ncbi:MAG: PHP domain-containing protein [Phycisphaerales bacterium]|nr:PHP domain-containing protein [Phycisphaerales bacterium]
MRLHKTVLHVHTNYSHDSNTSPEDLITTARRQGVTCIGVTDHDEIRGALEAREIGRERGVEIIVGEEVSTSDGHLIGLFLSEKVEPGRSALHTARRIQEQGGLVLVPHPFLGRHGLRKRMYDILEMIDAVEVCNGQNPMKRTDLRAARFALDHGLTAYAGADAHVRGHLAICYQEMPGFECPASFLLALRRAELTFGRFGAGYFTTLASHFACAKMFRGRLRGFGENSTCRMSRLERLSAAG